MIMLTYTQVISSDFYHTLSSQIPFIFHHKNTMCPLYPKEKRHTVKVYFFQEKWGMADIGDSLLKSGCSHFNTFAILFICKVQRWYELFFSGADICDKCWPLMSIAIKIVDSALRGKYVIHVLKVLQYRYHPPKKYVIYDCMQGNFHVLFCLYLSQ